MCGRISGDFRVEFGVAFDQEVCEFEHLGWAWFQTLALVVDPSRGSVYLEEAAYSRLSAQYIDVNINVLKKLEFYQLHLYSIELKFI